MANLFKDTLQSSYYAKFRPHPPKEIINAIKSYLSERIGASEWLCAVDVGCGNGQCTRPLAEHFQRVYGFDTSAAQIEAAVRLNTRDNISYDVSPAETLSIASTSVQLVTACQAFHWFDFNKFYTELNRILVPNGVIALLGYRMPDVSHPNFQNNNRIKNLIKSVYKNPALIWAKKERELVDEGYASVRLPFDDEMRSDAFEAQVDATAEEVRGYVLSWSGYNSLKQMDEQKANQFLDSYDEEIKSLFGDKR
ncbi:unnamed protein product [Oppiella nova]|uniref:Methyltransferase type 11 domain-containing protein n=1 Tax=Oppiella nova TaxID=334625 RepID=A0A7R9L9V7_9ACAR|nr:unnamed protein product [Oppiella nova]CAG2160960.1 unnamed protein product [Oppiella nova]